MSRRRSARTARLLHPAAWWAWAAGMAAAAAQSDNPALLALLGAVIAFVVAARRTTAPWARSLVVFFRLGIAVIVLRVLIQIVFGNRIPGHVLFTLPRVPLPSWAAGVSIGGPVTAESVVSAACQGMRLAVILLAFGAANSLASPYRLLRCLPAVLYEAGVAVTVALAFAPELVLTIRAVREARRLRGRPTRGLAGMRGLAVPVLEGALDRSLELASSMDARGYGRRASLAPQVRRAVAVSLLVGVLAVLAGTYETLNAGTSSLPGLGLLTAGAALLVVAMALTGRRSQRTRYRPDPWRAPEWGVVAAGVAVVTAFAASGLVSGAGVGYSTYPLTVPSLALLPCLGVAAGLLPAALAPPPPPDGRPAVGPPAEVAVADLGPEASPRPAAATGQPLGPANGAAGNASPVESRPA